MPAAWEVLVISSDIEGRRNLTKTLMSLGFEPISASTLNEGLDTLSSEGIGLVFCDDRLSDGGYRDLLAAANSFKSKARIVVTSRQADWDEFLEAMRLGAFDVIASPCRPTDVEWMVIQTQRDERARAPCETPSSLPSPHAAAQGA